MRSLVRRQWLPALNMLVAAFVAGAVATPVLAAAGAQQAAESLYAAYHLTCHQFPFRSFFLLGPQTVYSQAQLLDLEPTADVLHFDGSTSAGWKLAICERDLAIYLGVLAVGLLLTRSRGNIPGLGYALFGLLSVPIAVDGTTQLLGWRESTWELRVVTGVLFGVAAAWFVLPRVDRALGGARVSYAPLQDVPVACDLRPPLQSPRA
jgi:uncharacterized membrane protein